MYTENFAKDTVMFSKAVITNVIAGVSPSLFTKLLTKDTGRGEIEENYQDIANYYAKSFYEFFDRLSIEKNKISEFMADKVVLEYGPGDTLGNALFCYAYGAKKIICVDLFPLAENAEKHEIVYKKLIDLLPEELRERGKSVFKDANNLAKGLDESKIVYKATKLGLSNETNVADLVLTRGVLQSVKFLDATFKDISNALKIGGMSIHKVEMESVGLDRYTDFDFLTWPEWMYTAMYNNKGIANRWRINKYKDELAKNNLTTILLEPTKHLDSESLNKVKPHMCKKFKTIPDEELSAMGFWLAFKK